MDHIKSLSYYFRHISGQRIYTSNQKHILIMIANRIGQNMCTWIKVKQLADECEISERQLKRDLAYLQKQKILIIEKRITGKGKQNEYYLNDEILQKYAYKTKNEQKSYPQADDTKGHPCHLVPDTKGHPCHLGQELSTSSSPEALGLQRISDKLKINIKNKYKHKDCAFERFWNSYPRKENKKRAFLIFKQKGLDKIADKLIADIEKRKSVHDPWQRGIIPHASTYLTYERWNDEIEIKKVQTNAINKQNYQPVRQTAKFFDIESIRYVPERRPERQNEVKNLQLKIFRELGMFYKIREMERLHAG